ncbi:MAG: uroporphyrinogen-III synthase [Candidatus Binatia bacterium]
MGSTPVGCIGPITAATAREYGLDVAVQPVSYTVPALAEASVAYFSSGQ